MKPVWIIDLTDQLIVEKQLTDYISSYGEDAKSWFYYSKYNALGLDTTIDKLPDLKKKYEEIVDNYGKVLLKPNPKQNSLIYTDIFKGKGIQGIQNIAKIDSLDIYILGDLKNPITQKHFNTLTHELKELNKNELTSWIGSDISCYYYGLLWMPNNLDVKGFLTDDDKQFLNQVHNFQSVNSDYLFDNIFIYQSNIDEQSKEDSFASMALGLLTISGSTYSNDIKQFLQQDKSNLIYNAKTSGIFYETETHKEQQAFILSDIVLNSFKNEKNTPFLDLKNAEDHVNNSVFGKDNLLNPDRINAELTNKTPQIDDVKLEAKIFKKTTSVNDFWHPAKLWIEYYNNFLLNLKKDTINNVKQELHWKFLDFQKVIDANTNNWIKDNCSVLEKSVFEIFNENNPSDNCSLQQLLEIAKKHDTGINIQKDKFIAEDKKINLISDSNVRFAAFPLPAKYQKALETAKLIYSSDSDDNVDETKVLESLETQIKNHPVIFLSQIIRAILIALCLIFVSIPLFKFLCVGYNPILNISFLANHPIVGGIVASSIPLILFVWKSRQYTNTLKSLINQYIAILYHQTNNKAYKISQQKVWACFDQLSNFSSKWLIKEKIENKLLGGLFSKLTRDFNFTPNSFFQPLLTSPTDIKTSNSANTNNIVQIKSGSFDEIPLIADHKIPSPSVSLKMGNKLISQINLDDKMQLIRKLMSQEISVNQIMIDQIDIIEPPFISLLLLDVSGSMRGDSFNKLIEIVANLKTNHGDKLRWIAFSNEAKLDTECNQIIPKDFGYTSLEKGFEKIKQVGFPFDKIVLVSDGAPTNENSISLKGDALLELTNNAKSIGKPIDVIYIGEKGTIGEEYMHTLASETGGDPQSTSIEALEEKMKKNLFVKYQLADANAKLTFDKLLKMGHVEACSGALMEFCKNNLSLMNNPIEKMIADYAEDDGIAAFCNNSLIFDDLRTVRIPEKLIFKTTEINDTIVSNSISDLIERVSDKIGITDELKLSYNDDKNTIVTVMGVRQIKGGLSSLKLTYTPDNKEAKKDVVFDYFKKAYPNTDIVNLFNKELEFKS
jgi:hypothetical protein